MFKLPTLKTLILIPASIAGFMLVTLVTWPLWLFLKDEPREKTGL